MSALPRKVREAGEKADKDLKALQEAANKKEGSQEDGNTGLDVDGKPVQAAPDDGTPPAKKEGDGIDWKSEHQTLLQKHKVLTGKYDNEVPQLHRELRELKETLTSLQQQVNQSGNPDGDQGHPAEEGVPDDIKEMYGENLIQFITDRAKSVATSVMKPVADRVDTVTAATENTRKETFYTRLSEAHSDWEQINVTEGWLDFLKEIVPEIGSERQWIINNAIANLNPDPIILQLTAFKKRTSGQGEQQRLASQETPSGEGKPAADPAGSGGVQAINESDISKFYTDVSLGKYKGREEYIASQERLIQAAHKAGKIVMDVSGTTMPPLY